MSILVCLLFSGVWLNHQNLDKGSAFANESEKEHSDKVLIENTRILTKKIENKLKDQNLDITSIGISIQSKEIYIQVNDTQQHLNTVEEDIKKIIDKLAQKTIFKDYSIGVYKQIMIPPDANKSGIERNGLLSKITMQIQDSLKVKGYVEIENILTEKRAHRIIVEVNTSLQKNNLTNTNRGKEIERETRESLTEEILALMTEIQKVEVNVYDVNQEKIN